MTQPAPEVWVVPDIALLVCHPMRDAHDTTFLDYYWRFFLDHTTKVDQLSKHNFSWLLSDELINYVLAQPPWVEHLNVPQMLDMYLFFADFVGRQRQDTWSATNKVPSTQITPDVAPNHIDSDTKEAWLGLLELCVQKNARWSYIASCPQQCTLATQVSATTGTNSATLPLVCQSAQWDSVVKAINPWVRHDLPAKRADFYSPPASWRWGQDFPTQTLGSDLGFQDEKGRVWVWDKAEKHW
ncbi:MAG: hypothetical protein H0U76_05020, partial [Ktedonobacteraceae bacterium]|nr:hypothetical protein [Ktedonobacteraceae bacterium]